MFVVAAGYFNNVTSKKKNKNFQFEIGFLDVRPLAPRFTFFFLFYQSIDFDTKSENVATSERDTLPSFIRMCGE